MRLFLVISFLASILFPLSTEARTIKGGSQLSSKTNLIGMNVVSYQGAYLSCPTESMFDYYRSKNLLLIRMPISGSLLQPTLLGDLSSTYLTCLDNVFGYASARGQKIVLDLHSAWGSYTSDDFVDFWTKVATHFKDSPAIGGYDLKNEPGGSSYDESPETWFNMAQAAITAIRTVDTTTPIWLESVHWSSAWLWQTWGEYALAVTDPSNLIVYSAHAYADRDSSGTHYDWETEVAAGDQLTTPYSTLDTNILIKRYTPFVTWCTTNGKSCNIGETGIGTTSGWLEALDNGINYLTKNNVSITYWAAGSGWGEYGYTAEPKSNGQDREQVSVLSKYSGVYSSSLLYVSGPARGTEDVASDDFTVSYNGYIRHPFTIYPQNTGTGTFIPSSVSCTTGFNCSGTFTFTANDTEVYLLSTLNSGSVHNITQQGFATVTDSFSHADMIPVNAYSIRKIYAPYFGYAFRLRRDSDDEERDFGFTDIQLDSLVDTTAIASWGGSDNLYVVYWYDQGPSAHNAIPSWVDRTPSEADQPRFVLNCYGLLPCVRFNGANAMEAVSAVNGLSGQTLLWVDKPSSHLLRGPVNWRFISGQHVIYSADTNDRFYAYPYSGSSPTAITNMRLYREDSVWQSNTVTWLKNSTDASWSYKNGLPVGKTTATNTSVVYPMRSNLQLGFMYIGGGYFSYYTGDLAELVVYNSNTSASNIEYFQNDQISFYGLENTNWSGWEWPSPTLDQSTTAENDPPWRGVNQGGIGFGTAYDSIPLEAAQPYYIARGFNITRFPVAWEMIQQGLCSADTTLDSTEMAKLDSVVSMITSAGMDILIDLHNYGKYNYTYNGRTCESPPDGGNIVEATTGSYFANVWSQLATRYASNPKVKFDLMNEPHGQSAASQVSVMQSAINAIRTAGATQPIFVEFGAGYASCTSVSTETGAAFLTLTDSQSNLILECHNYLRSGTAGDGYCPDCDDTATQNKGLLIVTNATTYAKANGIKLFIGEFGLGFTPSAYSEGKKMLDYIAANQDSGSGGWVGWTAWGGGPNWGEGYMIKVEPLSLSTPYVDRPNMRFLSTYATDGTWPSAIGSWPYDIQFP